MIDGQLLQKLGEYRERGDELVVKECPFCHGTKDDAYKFSINKESGMYHCPRASCDAKGNIITLQKYFGLNGFAINQPPKSKITCNFNYAISISDEESQNFLKLFGFKNPETLKTVKISFSNGRYFFPMCEPDGNITAIGSRTPDAQYGCEVGSEFNSLYGAEKLLSLPPWEPLVKFEGASDYWQAVDDGIRGALGRQNASNAKYLENQKITPFFKDREVVLVIDNDANPKTKAGTIKSANDQADALYDLGANAVYIWSPDDAKDYREWRKSHSLDEFLSEYKNHKVELQTLPLIHISDIKLEKPSYLIDRLWLQNSVGFISAQPGELKTWLAWEYAVSVASGTDAFKKFKTQRGKVISFNAEDNLQSMTKLRVVAIAKSKNLKLNDLDLFFINLPSLQLDDEKIQALLVRTVKIHKPTLLTFDPLRNVHGKNEDKASEMTAPLNFLRLLQRDYGCSVLLVCHDRKPSKDDGRRASMTRGTNALEGWRDSAVYLDRADDKTKVTIYHRGAPSPEPFHFRLLAKNENGLLAEARLEYIGSGEIKHEETIQIENAIRDILKRRLELSRAELVAEIGKRKAAVLDVISDMVLSGTLQEFLKGKKRVLRFPEPMQSFSSKNEAGTDGNQIDEN